MLNLEVGLEPDPTRGDQTHEGPFVGARESLVPDAQPQILIEAEFAWPKREPGEVSDQGEMRLACRLRNPPQLGAQGNGLCRALDLKAAGAVGGNGGFGRES